MAAGYSIKTAHVQGNRMLRNVKILSKIEGRLQDHQRRCSITVDTLTAELEEARTLAMKKNKPAAAGCKVTGTTGAGDAFASTLTGFIAIGKTIKIAMQAASINAASVVGYIDTQTGL